MEDLGLPKTTYDWGPVSRPQMRLTGAGRLHRIKQKAFVGNPVGYVEYQGRLIPYINIHTENRQRHAEHVTLKNLKGYEAKGGTFMVPEEMMTGPDDSYSIGSGNQFRQANASILSSVWHSVAPGFEYDE